MSDKHLNLFYSYNRDNQLIENNLTRAFIVTLRLLSPHAKDALLQALLHEPLQKLGATKISYHGIQLALQANMDRDQSLQMRYRYLLGLTSDRELMAEEEGIENQVQDTYASIPDGWIFDPQAGVCILIEAKVGSNPLNEQQVHSHADKWLGIEAAELPNHYLSITWVDVISAIEQVLKGPDQILLNTQEVLLLEELREFIGYYGYRIFQGIELGKLQPPPGFDFRRQQIGWLGRSDFLKISCLQPPPKFKIVN